MEKKRGRRRTILVGSRIAMIVTSVIFWAVAVVLVVSCYRFGHREYEDIIVTWCTIGFSILMIMSIVCTFIGKSFTHFMLKVYTDKENVNFENLEIIEALSSNYNAVYYLNLLTGEIRFLQLGGRIQKYMGEEYSEPHSLEWYANAYCNKLVTEEYKEAFLKEVCTENLREKLKDREYYTFNYEGDKNGRRNFFQMKAAKVNGSENHLVVGFADVDDEVRERIAQDELAKDALLQAQEANRTKDIILGNIAAEIIEPMDSIVEIARLLAANEANSDSVRANGKHILLETENMGIILNDIMEVNRIRNKQFVLKHTKTDINSMLDEVEAAISERAAEKKISVSFVRNIKHTEILCDEKRLITVLQHMANTAIEFSYDGGAVFASITETDSDNRKASYDIVIEDKGVGIDDNLVKLIYEPDSFDAVCMDKNAGRIIGLSVAKLIVDMMEGELVIESQKRKGTKNTVRISCDLA